MTDKDGKFILPNIIPNIGTGGRQNVGFLIESGGHNEFVAYLSVSKAQERREREIVRLFFGKRAVKKSRGLFCNLYEGYL